MPPLGPTAASEQLILPLEGRRAGPREAAMRQGRVQCLERAQVFLAERQRGPHQHLALFALQSLSRFQLSATPWTAAHQASLPSPSPE